ncbi:MAG: gamma carbonic anhydrase family protein [Oscillospiraceae bacterium]|nr:gamma carbonic anhydrase family protein [Oscillospiraceae bacterium]
MYYKAPSADVVGNISIGEDVGFWYGSVTRGDEGPITIGKGTNIQDGCVLHCGSRFPLKIGEYVTVGHGAILHGCEIGDGTLIGMGAIVLDGAKIGSGCIIGAGALVTSGTVVPDGMVAFGNPAKPVKEASPQQKEYNMNNAAEYIRIAKEELTAIEA